jgi:predicted RNase H-like HicB family nuclease
MENKLNLILKETDDGHVTEVKCNYPIVHTKNDKGYYVVCPVFKTVGFSSQSLEEAIKKHDIDLDIFFSVHLERNTIKSALLSLGWKRELNNSFGNVEIPHYILERAKYADYATA